MPVGKYKLLSSITKGAFVKNYFIGLCAFTWYLSSCLLLHQELKSGDFITAGFILACTIWMYNLDRLFGDNWELVTSAFKALSTKTVTFEKSHAKILTESLFALPALVLLPFIQWDVLTRLFIPAVVAVLYALPVLPSGLRIRELPFVKILAIAFVWAWLGSFLCTDTWYLHTYLLFAERFLFIFAITIPFDLRDLKPDEKKGIVTVPARTGKRRALVLARAALFMAIVLMIVGYIHGDSFYLVRASAMLVAIAIVERWHPERNWYYYLFFLDGCILLEAMTIFAQYSI